MTTLSDEAKKYLALVYRYLAIRNRSEKEIRDYLIKKKASETMIASLVEFLKKKKFLDDVVFTRSWILARARSRPKGKSALRFELLQKGIDKETIDTVLSEVQEDIPDQVTQAKQLIERRIEKVRDRPRQEIYAKVGGFLARRGFDWETIKKSIDEVLTNRV